MYPGRRIIACAAIAVVVTILGGCGSSSTSSSTSTSAKPPRRGLDEGQFVHQVNHTSCTGELDSGVNNETYSVELHNKYKVEHDTWDPEPNATPNGSVGQIHWWTWRTTSALFRGCLNEVTYEIYPAGGKVYGPDGEPLPPVGTITVKMNTPWDGDGANNRACITTGPFSCELQSDSRLSGDDQFVDYRFYANP
jgi:hypothetical protein